MDIDQYLRGYLYSFITLWNFLGDQIDYLFNNFTSLFIILLLFFLFKLRV